MSDSENSDHEVESSVGASHYSQKKPAPVKALAALAKARQAKAEKKALEKKEKEDMKKKKEEAVKAISSIRKPKEPMSIVTVPVEQPSAVDMMAMIAKLNEKLEKKSKKKVVIQSDSSSSEEEIVIKKPKKKIHVPAVDPEFEQWKSHKEKRQIEEASNQKEQQLKMDLKKLFSRY